MNKQKKILKINKKDLSHKDYHLTSPPRLEGKVKNAMMNPVKKKKKESKLPQKAGK
jgi:hypothetical protein